MSTMPSPPAHPSTRIQAAQPRPSQNDHSTGGAADFLRRHSAPVEEEQDVAEAARMRFTFAKRTLSTREEDAQGEKLKRLCSRLGTTATVPDEPERTTSQGGPEGKKSSSSGAPIDPRLKFFHARTIDTSDDRPAHHVPPPPPPPPAHAARTFGGEATSVPDLDQIWKSRTKSNRDISTGTAIRQLGESGGLLNVVSTAQSTHTPGGMSRVLPCASVRPAVTAQTRPQPVASESGNLVDVANKLFAEQQDKMSSVTSRDQCGPTPAEGAEKRSSREGDGQAGVIERPTVSQTETSSSHKRPRTRVPDLSTLNDCSREFLRDVDAVGRDREHLRETVKNLQKELGTVKQALDNKSSELHAVKKNAKVVTTKAQGHMKKAEEIKERLDLQRVAYEDAQNRVSSEYERCRQAWTRAEDLVKDSEGYHLEDTINRIRVQSLADLKVAMQKIEDLDSEILGHKQARDQALFDRAGAQEKIKDLEIEIREHIEKYEAKCAEVTEASARLAEQQGVNNTLDVRYNDLMSAHGELRQAKEETERSLGVSQGREVQLREQLAESSTILSGTIQELKATQEELAVRGAKISEMEHKLELAIEAAAAADRKYRDLILVQEESAQKLIEFQKERKEIEGRLQDATDSLRICQKGADQSTRLAEERADRIDELKAECRELRRKEEALKKRVESQQETERKLCAEEARAATLSDAVDSLKSRLGDTSAAKSTAEATVVELRGQLEILQSRCNELSRSFEEAQGSNLTASDTVYRLRADLDTAEKQVAHSQAELNDLNEKYNEIVEIVESNKADLENAHSVIEALEGRVSEISEQESSTSRTLQNALQNQEVLDAELQAERKARDQETSALRDKTNALEKEILSVKQEREKLQNQVKTLEGLQAQHVDRENHILERAQRGQLSRAELELRNYSAAVQREQDQREMSRKDNEIKRLEFERRALESKVYKAHAARSKDLQSSTKRTLPVLTDSSSNAPSEADASPQRSSTTQKSLRAGPSGLTTGATKSDLGLGSATSAVSTGGGPPRRSSRSSAARSGTTVSSTATSRPGIATNMHPHQQSHKREQYHGATVDAPPDSLGSSAGSMDEFEDGRPNIDG